MILCSCFNDLSNNWDPLNDVKEPTVEYLTWTADMCTGTKKKGPSPKKKKTKAGGKLVGREKNGKKSSSLSEEERAGLKKRMASRINMLKQSNVKQSNVQQSNVKIVVVRVAGGDVSDDEAAAPADEDGVVDKNRRKQKQRNLAKKIRASAAARDDSVKRTVLPQPPPTERKTLHDKLWNGINEKKAAGCKRVPVRAAGGGVSDDEAATPTIFVRGLCSETVAVQMPPSARSTTVADLKKVIREKTNVPAELQSLFFAGKFATLEDDQLLAECNIGSGSTLTSALLALTDGLRGGMGCGPSKPRGDDESAYREEVTVVEAGHGTSTAEQGLVSGSTVGGSKKMSAKVVAAIATIKTHIVELQADVDTHGSVPSPELSAVAARQAADAVGSTLCVIKSLEQQLAEATGKVGSWRDEYKDPILKPLERDLAAAETTLKAAVEVCATKWNLAIEAPFQAAVDNQATFAALPMSVPEKQGGAGSDASHATMIGVIGSLYLLKGETAAAPVPPAWMFAAFARKRVAESTALVKMILRDVDLYNNALSVQIELPDGAAVVAKLAEATSDDAIRHQAVAGGSASSTGTVTEAWIKQTAAAASASAAAPDFPLDSLAYVAHARLAAGPVSIKLYEVVSELLHAAHSIVGAECVPGMVKGAPRIVFKSMTKYGGNTSKCHDLARATVSVRTLADVVVVVLAVLACPLIVVIRIKNRMDPAYDALPIGGYRDVQFQCLLQDSAGKWFYAELQINLVAMIAIKEGGGHHAFDQARLIDAFSERTLRYNGKPSEVVFGMVRSGVLLALDLTNNVLDESQAAALQGALESAECRIRSLVLTNCHADPAFGKTLAGMLASGRLKLTVLKSVHFSQNTCSFMFLYLVFFGLFFFCVFIMRRI